MKTPKQIITEKGCGKEVYQGMYIPNEICGLGVLCSECRRVDMKEFNLKEKIEGLRCILKEFKELELSNVVVEVIINHILQMDKEFIELIKEKITKGCMGTSANCYLIKKAIDKLGGEELEAGEE